MLSLDLLDPKFCQFLPQPLLNRTRRLDQGLGANPEGTRLERPGDRQQHLREAAPQGVAVGVGVIADSSGPSFLPGTTQQIRQ